MEKIPVYATYDNKFRTWNVVDFDKKCLFYGTADDLDKWIDAHQDTHVDVSDERLHDIVNDTNGR